MTSCRQQAQATPSSPMARSAELGTRAHLRGDVNSEKEAQPVSLVGIGSSALQTSDPTESRGAPWVVSMGTSKLADQLGAVKGKSFILRRLPQFYGTQYFSETGLH